MTITIHNYEVFFIDYHEGNLSPKETEALMVFLDAHPELKEEFETFHLETLSPDLSITYNNKSSLKKAAVASAMEVDDELLIGYLEGDLPDKERIKVKDSIAKDLRKGILYQQYQSTKLTPDTISFPNKERLKKQTGIIFLYPQTLKYAAAALIIIMLGISAYFIFSPGLSFDQPRYDLARLENRSVLSLAGDADVSGHTMKLRSSGQMQATHREEIILVKMTAGNTIGAIPISADLLATNNPVARPYEPAPSIQESIASEALAINETAQKKSFAGRIISGLVNKVKKPFSTNNSDPKTNEPGDNSFWNLAKLGMQGVNALGDHDYTLVRQYNDKGNVKGLRIVGE